MENKIVVHMKDGAIHKGVTNDFDSVLPTFHLLPAEGGGVPMQIEVERMKALFYVKDYAGNRDFVARRQFDEARRHGHRAILTFQDGEEMWGSIAPQVSDETPGFFFFPSDPEDNNARVFVVRSSLDQMREVT